MEIREYLPDDCEYIVQLFKDTVRTINSKDYDEKQIDAWLSNSRTPQAWNEILSSHHTFVAIINNAIVGFADIDDTGYLDHLFVSKDYQHQGIATQLCNKVENLGLSTLITTDASITAKPFFMKRGYQIIQEQQVLRDGVYLTNFKMNKKLESLS